MPVEKLRREIGRVLGEMGVEEGEGAVLERPRNPEHGDWATNVAMTLARSLRRPSLQIAGEIAERLDREAAGVSAVEVAGAGFINFRLTSAYLREGLAEILRRAEDFGRSDAGAGQPVNVEFVSANPTGPLHVGHGRGAALGDAIAELLAWSGWRVHREYYYNDAGEQIARLARSVLARYQQAAGREVPFPEDGYHGVYVREIADALRARDGERWAGVASQEALDAARELAVERLMGGIEEDLAEFRVRFDQYFLESSLYTGGGVERTVSRLRETGLVYEHEGALWLRTTEFGDDKDRVMVKSTGHPTYFLPDVTYHVDKWGRGFHRAINVQGADHHGTISRVRAGVQALELPAEYPEYVLHQMVLVMRGNEEVKFSKRAGDYVTLRDLFEEAGVDVTRYFFLMRRPESQLTFDLDLALEQSDRNPVYKVQYAYARMASIFRRAGADGDSGADAPLELLSDPVEAELIKLLLRLPEVIAGAAEQHAPHAVCEFLEEVAAAVNSWYHAGNRDPSLRVVGDRVSPEITRARLALAQGVRIVLANGLSLLGITAPERMTRDEPVN